MGLKNINSNGRGALSALGQYVHFYWSSYEKQGTRRWSAHEESPYAGNFNPRIFSDHKKLVLQQARRLKQNNLKEMESEYNMRNNQAYDILKAAFDGTKTLQGKTNLLQPLLELLNQEYNDPTLAAEIIKDLHFENNTIVYRPTKDSVTNSSQTFSLHLQEAEQYRRVNTLFLRANELKKYLLTLEAEGVLDAESVANFISEIKKVEIDIQKYVTNKESLEEIYKKIDNKVTIRGKQIAKEEANILLGRLQLISQKVASIKKINEQLQARFAEIIGEVSKRGIAKVTNQAIRKVFMDIKQSGLTGTKQTSGKQGMDLRIFMDLDQELLSDEYEAIKLNNADKSKTHLTQIITKGENGDSAIYSFKSVDDTVNQKSDIDITLATKEAHISLKNTDLSKVGYNSFTTPTIGLQNSDMMLYLLDMQNQMDNLGTHYLNIFSTHPDYDSTYSFMRQIANESFTLALLYSSLTGAGQMRKGGQANILAIYDKAKKLKNGQPRIKFFDMFEIIQRVSQNYANNVDIIHPRIYDLQLQNEWAGEKNEYDTQAANTRVTKVLLQARKKNLAVRLSHDFLNSIYK